MSTPIVTVNGLGKRYRIGAREEAAGTLAQATLRTLGRPLHNLRNLYRLSRHESGDSSTLMWALRDVSFDVSEGEVIGIVGPNGAGKSTLLKLLSRITDPTSGKAIIRGRVASLLEVGTGFHPELTGRENIYLNGAILGMSRTEVRRKFDEIAAFSGVERFLDTPIKRYSTGMTVRLAFSVAAHLEPEVLLVDEVLAVGDAEFQRKCLDKMRDVTTEGRTVFLVSHNLSAIRRLCPRTLYFRQGHLVMDGETEGVLRTYLGAEGSPQEGSLTGDMLRARLTKRGWGNQGTIEALRCIEIGLEDTSGEQRSSFRSDEDIALVVVFDCIEEHGDLRLIVNIVDEENRPILSTQNVDGDVPYFRPKPGRYHARCIFPANLFGERRHYVSVSLVYPHIDEERYDRAISFDVSFTGYNDIQYMNVKNAFLRPRLEWRTQAIKGAPGGNIR